MVIYIAEREDTLGRVASKFGVSKESIIEKNSLEVPVRLTTGEALVIIPENNYHTVLEGESIQQIANNYNVNVLDLFLLNPQISNIRELQAGDQVFMPVEPKLGVITANGYCYPNIDLEILNAALPELTYVSIFSYQIKADGGLTPINDEAIIEESLKGDTAPKMVITNIDEEGGFSSDLAHTILADENLQNILLDNIVRIMEQKQYIGLDLDLEYLYPEDKELYNNFIIKASEKMHALQYKISSAIAPKTSENQQGLLYEAHDYEVHGKYLDEVILMTYEWGYTYGPPMAVAPIDQVKRVLDYAVSVIPSKKILMGIPNYGYDWKMPFVEGDAAKSLNNVEAIKLAQKYNSIILYNTISQSPYFYYLDEENGNVPHVVWFEDARSIQAKLNLVLEYNLGGISYWTINRAFPQNWEVLNSMYDVRKVI